MVCLHSRCHIPNSKGPVGKMTDKEIFRAPTTLFALYKNNTLTKVTFFFLGVLQRLISAPKSRWRSCRSRLTISRIRHFVTNCREQYSKAVGVLRNCIMFTPSLVKICQLLRNLKWGTHTHTHTHTRTRARACARGERKVIDNLPFCFLQAGKYRILTL